MSGPDAPAGDTPARRPILRVVKGDLSAEELAALVTVISVRNAAAANAAAPKPKVLSAWNDPAGLVRTSHRVGPGQWRRSAWG